LLQAALGLEFDDKEIRLRNPHLPPFINDLTIKGLRLADATVDLALHGKGDNISMRIVRNDCGVRVSAIYS
jgi:hypothetical protein